jgi:hypothetical protein
MRMNQFGGFLPGTVVAASGASFMSDSRRSVILDTLY